MKLGFWGPWKLAGFINELKPRETWTGIFRDVLGISGTQVGERKDLCDIWLACFRVQGLGLIGYTDVVRCIWGFGGGFGPSYWPEQADPNNPDTNSTQHPKTSPAYSKCTKANSSTRSRLLE